MPFNKIKNWVLRVFVKSIIITFAVLFAVLVLDIIITVIAAIVFHVAIDAPTAVNAAAIIVFAVIPIWAIITEYRTWKKDPQSPKLDEYAETKFALFSLMILLSLIKEILLLFKVDIPINLSQTLFGITTLVACDRLLSYAKIMNGIQDKKKKEEAV